MKIQLTKSKSSRDRYYLVSGSMGNYGSASNHANNHFEIVNGIDRGNGYQGYQSVDYFLKCDYMPETAKQKVRQILKQKGLSV